MFLRALFLALACLPSALGQDLLPMAQLTPTQPSSGSLAPVAQAAAPPITATLDVNGLRHVLEQGPAESALAAAQRWLAASPYAGHVDRDAVLRGAVQRLRAAAGAQDGLPPAPPGHRTLALVRVTVPSQATGGTEVVLARWMEGESVEQAASGFLQRCGQASDSSNQAALQAEMVKQAQAAAAEAERQRVAAAAEAAAAAAAAAALPPHLGFAIPVTFTEAHRAPAVLAYRFGADVHATVEAFLREQSITEPASREAAGKVLIQLLFEAATKRLHSREVALGSAGTAATPATPATPAAAPAATARDVLAPRAMLVPLQVGAHGYDISLTAGASLWDTAGLFCQQHWDVLAPALGAAVRGLFAAADSLGGGAGAEEGVKAVASLDTCRAVVFDLMVDMAAGGSQ